MHAELPLLDPLLWVRFLIATALIVVLPGWLFAGRWLGVMDRSSRMVLSVAVGLILPFVFHALLGRFGVPFHPLSYLLFIVPVSVLLGFWPIHRRTIAGWAAGIEALDPREAAMAWLAAALILGGLILGFGDLPAPPHVHDASNHAWITLQITELQSLDARVLDQSAAGTPQVGYLPGEHAAAALLSRLGQLAPYISIWMLTLSLCALIPLAWTILWRAWRVPAALLGIAVLIPASNQLGPAAVLAWGGFGQVAGFFVVALGCLALLAAWRARRPYACLLAGVVLGGISYLHASEILVVLGAMLLVPRPGSLSKDGEPAASPSLRQTILGVAALLLGMLALSGPEAWYLLADYSSEIEKMSGETKAFGDALNRLWRSGGREDLHQALFVLAWFFGWRSKPLRRITVASMLLGIFYLLLQTLGDPVSRFLSKPFYSQATRILYLQFYLLAPLMAWPLVLLYRRLRDWRGMRLASAVIVLLMSWMLIAGLQGGVESYANNQSSVPFSVGDYEHAMEMGARLEPDALVANLWDDGSTWAMHVSGLQFLHPYAWPIFEPELGDLNPVMRGLAAPTWPVASSRLLEKYGLEYLYVSDTVWGEINDLRRADFDTDSRFEALLVGESSTLYRIKKR